MISVLWNTLRQIPWREEAARRPITLVWQKMPFRIKESAHCLSGSYFPEALSSSLLYSILCLYMRLWDIHLAIYL